MDLCQMIINRLKMYYNIYIYVEWVVRYDPSKFFFQTCVMPQLKKRRDLYEVLIPSSKLIPDSTCYHLHNVYYLVIGMHSMLISHYFTSHIIDALDNYLFFLKPFTHMFPK